MTCAPRTKKVSCPRLLQGGVLAANTISRRSGVQGRDSHLRAELVVGIPAFYARSPTRTTEDCVRDALAKLGAFAAAVQKAEDPVELLPQVYSHKALRTIIFATLYYQVKPFSISWLNGKTSSR